MKTALTPLDRPQWLPESSWPWHAGALDTPVGRVAVTDIGAGPTLLLVHTGSWSFVWRDLLRELTPRYRCVTVDAPGCGRSERCPKGRTTLAASTTVVGAVVDELDLRDITLVAHDLGCLGALAALSDRTERVAAIAAINTFGWRPAGAAFRGMLAVMGSAPVRGSDAWFGWLPRATSGTFGVGRNWSKADRAVFRAGIDADARRAWHRYLGDARRADPLYATVQTALRGPLADRPLLTIFGQRNDPLKFQRRWKALFPHARQETIPKGNHFPMCDAPQLVADIISDWHTTEVTIR